MFNQNIISNKFDLKQTIRVLHTTVFWPTDIWPTVFWLIDIWLTVFWPTVFWLTVFWPAVFWLTVFWPTVFWLTVSTDIWSTLSGKPNWRERLSTMDLFVLTSFDRLLFIWKTYYETSYLNEEVSRIEPSLLVIVFRHSLRIGLSTNWLLTNWLSTNWLLTNWLSTNWLSTNWLSTKWTGPGCVEHTAWQPSVVGQMSVGKNAIWQNDDIKSSFVGIHWRKALTLYTTLTSSESFFKSLAICQWS
jgi:hypothetical protein